MSQITTIKMTSTQKGSPDGLKVCQYEKGRVYDVPDELAQAFLSIKCARRMTRKPPKMETPPAVDLETPEG